MLQKKSLKGKQEKGTFLNALYCTYFVQKLNMNKLFFKCIRMKFQPVWVKQSAYFWVTFVPHFITACKFGCGVE